MTISSFWSIQESEKMRSSKTISLQLKLKSLWCQGIVHATI